MSSYTFPIKMAILTFPVLAGLITAPFLIYYYRKYGTLGKLRSLILYSFVFYLLCAYYLIILPLPPRSVVAKLTTPHYELQLFKSEYDFLTQSVLRLTQPSTYLPALKQSVFLEPLFNLLLFVPFGIYGRYYFKWSVKKTIVASFLLSLFFELTQLSGLYFIYPRPYRLFDVNDLFHNTLGGLIGFIIEPLFVFFLPSRATLDSGSFEQGQRVSVLRRGVAFFIDWFSINLVSELIQFLLSLVGIKLATDDVVFTFFWIQLEVICYFVGVTFLTNGTTLGKKIVRIKVVEEGTTKVSFSALLKRYAFFYLTLTLSLPLFNYTLNHLTTPNHVILITYLLILFLSLGIILLISGNLLYAQFRRKNRLFHEKASHTYTISTITIDSK